MVSFHLSNPKHSDIDGEVPIYITEYVNTKTISYIL